MIVGFTNTGKTVCHEILSKSLSALSKKNHEEPTYKMIKRHILNPKAISMGELYG